MSLRELQRPAAAWHGECCHPDAVLGKKVPRQAPLSCPRLTRSLMASVRAIRPGHWAFRSATRVIAGALTFGVLLFLPPDAHASLISEEVEDKLATFLAVFVIFLVPIVLIVLFWMVTCPPREDRPQTPPSAIRGHPDVVSAVPGVRRAAVATGLAVGLLEAGHVQDGVRHRRASGCTEARAIGA